MRDIFSIIKELVYINAYSKLIKNQINSVILFTIRLTDFMYKARK